MILISALIAYAFGYFKIAFWITVISSVNSVLGGLRAFVDPDWYMHKRSNAGLSLSHPGMSLFFTKLLTVGIAAAFAYYLYGFAYP